MKHNDAEPQVKVGIYLRVSTEEQRERQSIATQRDFGERYCQLHGLAVEGRYVDDGVTGTVPIDARPEGNRMLADARAGKFNVLLVFRLDRLGRDTRLILNAVAELEKLGIRVRSMTEEFDTATSTGRLMLTMLSGFAAHERDVIRERSIAGTNRVAEAGAWLGGIVPYGYRKIGEKASARIVVSDEPIANLPLSEADVIRSIFHMAGVERKSCFTIADYLNRLGVPCAYVRDGRTLLRGKRKERTSGWWRPARVRNMIVSPTYMGRHEYGKRSRNKTRKLITRAVPAIVTEEIWKKAQEVLRSNQLFSNRNVKNRYLLRGLIKCGLCNLTYVGMVNNRRANHNGNMYYRCNGKQGARGIYGANGHRCPSKDVSGDRLEKFVWADVESFLREPGAVLEELRKRIANKSQQTDTKQDRSRLESALQEKADQRARMLGLFRRGRITEEELDSQLKEIEAEEEHIRFALEEMKAAAVSAEQAQGYIRSAEDLLHALRLRLDEGVSWELKRELVEVLVGHIKAETIEHGAHKESAVTITYRFPGPTVTCTDMRAYVKRDLEYKGRAPDTPRAKATLTSSIPAAVTYTSS